MAITPYLYYRDVAGALEFLSKAFGFRKHGAQVLEAGGSINHAAMKVGDDLIMMGCPGSSYRNPKSLGQSTQSLYINVDDVDAHFERARKSGASILEELADTEYGHRRLTSHRKSAVPARSEKSDEVSNRRSCGGRDAGERPPVAILVELSTPSVELRRCALRLVPGNRVRRASRVLCMVRADGFCSGLRGEAWSPLGADWTWARRFLGSRVAFSSRRYFSAPRIGIRTWRPQTLADEPNQALEAHRHSRVY